MSIFVYEDHFRNHRSVYHMMFWYVYQMSIILKQIYNPHTKTMELTPIATSNEAISQELHECVLQNFGINVIASFRICRGSSDVYILETKKQKYVLKLYLGKHNIYQITQEINICNTLRSNGICVPYYVKMTNGREICLFKNRYYTITHMQPGFWGVKNTYNLTDIHQSVMLYSRILANLQPFSASYKFDINIYTKSHLASVNNKIVYKMSSFKNCLHLDLCKRMLNLISRLYMFDVQRFANLTHKVSPSDYTHYQFIYDSECHIILIADWTSIKTLPLSYVLFRLFIHQIDSYDISGVFNITDLIEFIINSSSIINLNNDDIRLMPYIFVFFSVTSTFFLDLLTDEKRMKSAEDLLIKQLNLCEYIISSNSDFHKMIDKMETLKIYK